MRCPKCHYISFDAGERCRNCGYDFSLSSELESIDLPVKSGNEPEGPLADFDLKMADPSLPLFPGRPAIDDDTPLVTPPAVPRAPLAVRRSNPGAQRPRPRQDRGTDEPRLDLEAPEIVTPLHPDGVAADEGFVVAPLIGRAVAGVIDAAIMLAIHAAVIYFTLRICGLSPNQVFDLPPIPLGAFLLMLAGGYFATFTAAGGQTIGKMATGIRVIPATDPDPALPRVSFGVSVVRAAGYLVSVIPAGLGLLPILLSSERRALHDRLADTRVVRA
jgi:uncharacterized RDD family membrane protein YckC